MKILHNVTLNKELHVKFWKSGSEVQIPTPKLRSPEQSLTALVLYVLPTSYTLHNAVQSATISMK